MWKFTTIGYKGIDSHSLDQNRPPIIFECVLSEREEKDHMNKKPESVIV